MKLDNITINDQALTASELRTLRMAIGALELQLSGGVSDSDVPLSGADDHLQNLSRLRQLIGDLSDERGSKRSRAGDGVSQVQCDYE